jgi:hypothetical protein
MTPFTCNQVEEQLDLFAAAECDAPTSAAIDRHLADCPSCAGKVEESRQLLGLLGLRLREPDRLRQLQASVRAESRRQRRPVVLLFLRRYGAAAAMLLLTIGLMGRLAPGLSSDREGIAGPTAMLSPSPVGLAPGHRAAFEMVQVEKGGNPPAPKHDGQLSRLAIVPPLAKKGTELREELRVGLAAGRLPPPTVDLELLLVNSGPSDLTLSINERTEVEIDLQGPGVITLPATAAESGLPIPPQTLPLPAGQQRGVRLTRLESVSPLGRWFSYWTEPGEYELRVRLRTAALLGTEGARRRPVTVAVSSGPITIRVPGNP